MSSPPTPPLPFWVVRYEGRAKAARRGQAGLWLHLRALRFLAGELVSFRGGGEGRQASSVASLSRLSLRGLEGPGGSAAIPCRLSWLGARRRHAGRRQGWPGRGGGRRGWRELLAGHLRPPAVAALLSLQWGKRAGGGGGGGDAAVGSWAVRRGGEGGI